MAKRLIPAGATDQTIDVFVQDSSSATGAGLTGLVYNTSNLTCYYRKGATGTPTALSLATQTVGGAHSDGGFVAVDATNCPGQYRLDLSDTIVATAGMVTLYLQGATDMAPVLVEIEVGTPAVNVTQFGGTAGTFSLGRPEVNTSGLVLYSGTIGSTGNDDTHINFTPATYANDTIIDYLLVIEDVSSDVKEGKWITDWDFSDALATLDSALSFTPEDGADQYWLLAIKRNVRLTATGIDDDAITAAKLATDAVTEIVDAVVARFSDDTGTAQAGGSTTITLRSGAVATANYYNGAIVTIYGGTGEGQSRKITGYVGSTRVATVDSAWAVEPDNTSTYFVIGRSV